jgi:hypothetical protein
MLKGVLAGVAVAILLSGAAAQTSSDRLTTKQQVLQKKFQGWDGIVFQCDFPDRNPLGESLCETAARDARFLSSSAGVAFFDCSLCASLWQRGIGPWGNGSRDGLRLTLEVSTLREPPYAGSLRLWAGNYYVDAIETNAGVGSPESQPKSGYLVLWGSNKTAFFGSGTGLADTLSTSIEGSLKDFFSTYLEARR